MERNRYKIELAVAIAIILIFACLFVSTFITKHFVVTKGIPSMLWPRIVMIGIMGLGIYLLFPPVQWFKANPKAASAEPKQPILPKKVYISAIMFCVYAALWMLIGFSLSTLMYIVAQSKFLNRKASPVKVAAVGAGATVLLNVLFGVVFKISFPEPLLILIRGY